MTTTELELIPSEFWSALEMEPDCFTLRSAIADRCEELGWTDAAECLRWTIAKRRTVRGGSWCTWGEDDTIPQVLCDSGIGRTVNVQYLFSPNDCVKSYRRLVWRWSLLSPKDRQACWEWEAPK
jgi:hypothetical protein